MPIQLSDDGTLDTVLRCSACGEEFRYNFDGAADDPDGTEDLYDRFVEDSIADATSEHDCPVITADTDGVEITLTAESEDIPVRGNFATDEPELDRADEDEILRRLENGDEWAWFCAHVRVTYRGIVADDYLGACSYADEKDFRDGGYYADMVSTCIDTINATLKAINACEMAPHSVAIIACQCGYKRSE